MRAIALLGYLEAVFPDDSIKSASEKMASAIEIKCSGVGQTLATAGRPAL